MVVGVGRRESVLVATVSGVSGVEVPDPPAMDEDERALVQDLMQASGCSDACRVRLSAWGKVAHAFCFALDHAGTRFPIFVPCGVRESPTEADFVAMREQWVKTIAPFHQDTGEVTH
jgi:hypothetical protein